MPRRALIENRPWLLLGIALALSFWMVSGSAVGELYQMALKGGSVAALAIYAFLNGQGRNALLVALVMALGAAGDIGMELDTVTGGAFFAAAHIVAIALYLLNPRARRSASQIAAAAALAVLVPAIAWQLSGDVLAGVYGIALGLMAATAWLSRFSRYAVGMGALLFVASDMLIFARLGGRIAPEAAAWLVWPLYYAGQLMIVTGVVHQRIARERALAG